jgi:hypothetical protein
MTSALTTGMGDLKGLQIGSGSLLRFQVPASALRRSDSRRRESFGCFLAPLRSGIRKAKDAAACRLTDHLLCVNRAPAGRGRVHGRA